MTGPASSVFPRRIAFVLALCVLTLGLPAAGIAQAQTAASSQDTEVAAGRGTKAAAGSSQGTESKAASDHFQDKTCTESDSTRQTTVSGTPVSAAGHQHRNISGTGPGPQGELVSRTPAQNERLYQRLKSLYMSPYCPGLTLGSCGSGAAELLRADLHEWVFEGQKEKDITSYMIATFGEEIMGRPPFRGSAIVVWVAPILAILLGLWMVWRWIRKNAPQSVSEETKPRMVQRPPLSSIDPELDARLEAEVKAHYR